MSLHPVTATALVGRHAELAILTELLESVLRGTGATVLIGGEAGIGKSRLVRELQQRFRHNSGQQGKDGLILAGQCDETDRDLPYAPILDLLRALLGHRSADEMATILSGEAAAITALLPELTNPLPVQPPALGAEQERQRIFHALLRVLMRLATAGPLLVVVEDLHWSDDTSLDFLLQLARRSRDSPILLVLTYRSDEIQPSLRHSLAALDRGRLAVELELERLSLAEVDSQLRAIFSQPQPIRRDFLQTLHELTDGNPFFIEEVLRALIAAGEIYQTAGRWDRKELAQLHIPRSIQDAVARRSEQLSPAAREVLQLAAVAGRSFDFTLLEAITGCTEIELLRVIRELIEAQLVAEESAERFGFRHALTRQAVYEQLLTRERRALHRTVGETLERLSATAPEPHLADLAYHFTLAEDWPRALDYATRAGEHALALYTPRAAAEQFTRALAAAARLRLAPSLDLCRSRARACAILGAFEEAERDLRTTLDLSRQGHDRVDEWQALLDLGELWGGSDYARSGDYLEQALDLARTLGQPRLIAQSLTRLGGWLINREQPARAEEVLEDARRIFAELNDQRGVAQTVDLLGTAADIAGDMARMHAHYQQAAALFRALDDRQGLSSTLATTCIRGGAIGLLEPVAVTAGASVAEALAEADEAAALARGMDWRAGEAYAALTVGSRLGAAGRYADALARLTTALELAQEIEHREWMTAAQYILGVLNLDLLSRERARFHIERAAVLARESGSLHFLHLTLGQLARLRIDDGRLDDAATLLATLDPELPMSTIGQRNVWLARARLELARGDATAALAVLDRLFVTAANFTCQADIPYLAWLRGLSLRCMGDFARAEEALLAARRGAEVRGLLPLLWRVHHTLSQLYRVLSRDEERAAAATIAWATVEQLAAELSEGEPRATFLAAASAILTDRPAAAGPPNLGALTARERDVALLLAHGLSNRQIAERLYVGERTVETHVGNILAKLSFRSRTQVAAWAVQNGLISPEHEARQ